MRDGAEAVKLALIQEHKNNCNEAADDFATKLFER